MGALDLKVLGEVTVSRAGEVVACPSAKAMELLGLLVTRRARPVGRDVLAELLWPDEPLETTRRYLRQALWRLNSTLAAASGDHAGGGPVRPPFHPDTRPGWLRIDVRAFASVDLLELEEVHAATADRPGADLSEAQVVRLEAAAAGYGGEFLPGRRGEWCEPERVRAQELHLSVREALIAYHDGHGRPARALEHGRVVLETDPARETTHRLLMRLHHRRGDRAAALRQYTRCASALEEAYGVVPSAPTVLLHRRIQADDAGAVPARAVETDGAIAELNQRLNEIQSVLDTLVRALLPAERTVPGRPRSEPATGGGR